jgi:hypothetical protein
MMDPWNASAHRYFIAYTARNHFRHVLGLPVIDEYATFSSPIFFAPISILGKIYNAGISLGHLRDPEMGLDTGWPPLCVGIDGPAPMLPPNWDQTLIQELQSMKLDGSDSANSSVDSRTASVEDFLLQCIRMGTPNSDQPGGTKVFATNAPLLPRQLKRITQIATKASFAVAFSTGNRIKTKEVPNPAECHVIPEETLGKILTEFQRLEIDL